LEIPLKFAESALKRKPGHFYFKEKVLNRTDATNTWQRASFWCCIEYSIGVTISVFLHPKTSIKRYYICEPVTGLFGFAMFVQVFFAGID